MTSALSNPRLKLSPKARRFLEPSSMIRAFRTEIAKVERQVVKDSTDAARRQFNRGLNPRDRPLAPPRAGRPTTMGRFATDIVYERFKGSSTGNTGVGIDIHRLPIYWAILEIGTGKTANEITSTGSTAITIRKQYGREISANLFWAPGLGAAPNGAHTGASGEQLYYSSELGKGQVRRRKKRIQVEIKGKHYLSEGSRVGTANLRAGLVDAGMRIFK